MVGRHSVGRPVMAASGHSCRLVFASTNPEAGWKTGPHIDWESALNSGSRALEPRSRRAKQRHRS